MEILNQRLVVFLDILGFSEKLKNQGTEEVLKVMADIITEAKKFKFAGLSGSNQSISDNFYIGMNAYDSFFLVSHDLENNIASSCFILACCHLMNVAVCKGYFIRGVIDCADVVFEPSSKLVLCKEQPKLLAIEKKLEWNGVVLTDSAYKVIESSVTDKYSPIIDYQAPLKDETMKFNHALNWVSSLNLKHPSRKKLFDLLITPKKENTVKFVDFVLKSNSPQEIKLKDMSKGFAHCLKTTTNAMCMICDENGDNVPLENINNEELKKLFGIP